MKPPPRITRVALQPCPYCTVPVNAVSDLATRTKPQPGDISICLSCARPALFTRLLKLRRMGKAERARIAADAPEDWQHVLAMMEQVKLAVKRESEAHDV